jgi:serine/threonine-protein kinase HipA
MDLQRHFEYAGSAENPSDFLLCWHGHTVAYFKMGGKKEWQSLDSAFDKLFVMSPDGKLPMFLDNLKPEGWLKEHIKYDLQTDYIRDGRRFLSNLVIFPRNGHLKLNGNTGKPVMLDVHLTSLASFVDDQGIFTGDYKTVRGMNSDPVFESSMEKFWENKYMTRFSGAELKLPVCLTADGAIDAALESPFNVIAKYPGKHGYEALGVNEFLGMKMARAAGIETPAFALVDQGNGLPPAYLIERYDIPFKGQETDWMITQDFCTLTQNSGERKGAGSIEKIGAKVAEISKLATNDRTQENLEKLFQRTVLGWVINDEDMHMKNMSMLYKFDSEAKTLKDITFAPCYDATTDVFANAGGSEMSLSVGNVRRPLTLRNFVGLAKSLGIYNDANGNVDMKKVESVVKHIAGKAAETAIDFARNMPAFVKDKPWTYDILVQTSHVADRARKLGIKDLDWDSQAVWKDFTTQGARYRRAESIKTDPYEIAKKPLINKPFRYGKS